MVKLAVIGGEGAARWNSAQVVSGWFEIAIITWFDFTYSDSSFCNVSSSVNLM